MLYFPGIRLQLIRLQECGQTLYRYSCLDNVRSNLTELFSSWKQFQMTVFHVSHTMASGNCKSINNAIAGKMTSDVKGLDEVNAAVAKELNATSKGIPFHKATLHA